MSAPADPAAAAERRLVLERFYRGFNARDIDAMLAHMAPGVDWPNEATGGRVVGRAALRAYWLDQWREIDPRIEPLQIEITGDGAHVRVDQLIRARDGKVLRNRQAEHVYAFDGPFISRMTIVEIDESADDDDEDEDY